MWNALRSRSNHAMCPTILRSASGASSDRKEAAALLWIDADHDVQFIDDEAGAPDDVEMAARRRVEDPA